MLLAVIKELCELEGRNGVLSIPAGLLSSPRYRCLPDLIAESGDADFSSSRKVVKLWTAVPPSKIRVPALATLSL